MNLEDDKVIEKYLLESFNKVRHSEHSKGDHMLDDEFIISVDKNDELTISVVCYVEDAVHGKSIVLSHQKMSVSNDFHDKDVTKFFNKNNIVEHDHYEKEVIALYYNELTRWINQHA